MKTALLDQRDGLRTFVVIFETGDEAMQGLTSFAKEQGLSGSHFNAISAFSRAVVAYFDWSSKQYRPIPIDEQVEVLSFTGDVTIENEQPKVHAHVVLGKPDGTAHGGRLLEGHVRPTHSHRGPAASTPAPRQGLGSRIDRSRGCSATAKMIPDPAAR